MCNLKQLFQEFLMQNCKHEVLYVDQTFVFISVQEHKFIMFVFFRFSIVCSIHECSHIKGGNIFQSEEFPHLLEVTLMTSKCKGWRTDGHHAVTIAKPKHKDMIF